MQNRRSVTLLLAVASMLLATFIQQAGATHPRPQGATPMRLSLVPSYKWCTNPNGHHAEITYASCIPPVQSSNYLTVGSPDANGQPAKSTAFAKYTVQIGAPGPPDDSDVEIEFLMTDVRNQDDLSDYTGSLRAVANSRTTDHRNSTEGTCCGGSMAGTIQDIPYLVYTYHDISCTATADTTVGSTCSLTTSANATNPGAVVDGRRAITQKVGNLIVYDGGADGNSQNGGDVFMEEGVFVP
jgi:hypothetical protein